MAPSTAVSEPVVETLSMSAVAQTASRADEAGAISRRRDLAIITISTNEKHWLGPCLSSIYAHAGGIDLEVIVVDNKSTDGTRKFIETTFPQARVIESENGGFGYANNRGWEAANARYGLFLNPDTEIVDGMFEGLIAACDARPDAGLIGVRQLDSDRELYPTMRRFPNAARAWGDALLSERWPVHPRWSGERVLDMALYADEHECDWTVGAFMLARREALLSAGIMDERFFLQCEEPDLCQRIKRAGWSVRHLPIMTIVHHAGKAGIKPRMMSQEVYARRQYARKYFSGAHRTAYLSGIAARHLIRAAAAARSDTEDARRRVTASRSAVRTLMHPSEAPFCQPPHAASWVGPPRGPQPGGRAETGAERSGHVRAHR
jgi:N-acetylglucosaminyl-diphospho-decaprenol L-rhamnosyltransferase